MKISEANKGRKLSDEVRQRISFMNAGKHGKIITKNKKLLDKDMKICTKCKISKELREFHKNGYSQSGISSWCKSCVKERDASPKLKEMRRGYERNNFKKIVEVLGNKCVCCGEKYNPELKRSNVEIHHKFYTTEDDSYFNKYGINPQKQEALRMIKANKINELKKKYTLLCNQCNSIEGWVRKDGKKAFEAFCWLYGEGHFDEALKDDPSLKKLSEFMD